MNNTTIIKNHNRFISDIFEIRDEKRLSEIIEKIEKSNPSTITFELIEKSISFTRKIDFTDKSVKKIQECFFNKIKSEFLKNSFSDQMKIATRRGELGDYINCMARQVDGALVLSHWDEIDWQSIAPHNRFKLCESLASTSREYAQKLVSSLERIRLQELTLEDLLSLCKTLIASSPSVAKSMIDHFNLLGLQNAEPAILHQLFHVFLSGKTEVSKHLIENFDRLEIENFGLEDRLQFSFTAAKQVSAGSLVLNIDKMGLREAKPEEMLRLLDEISATGICFPFPKGTNFEKFFNLTTDLSDRLRLCYIIAAWNGFAARCLAKNFEKFDLQDADLEDRLRLAEIIVSKGEGAAESLACYFTSFNLAEANPERLQSLCLTIISKSDKGAEHLFKNIETLGLHQLELNDRIDFLRKIIKTVHGINAFGFLSTELCQFGLREAAKEVRLELCRSLISRGEHGSESVCGIFDWFGLQDEEQNLRLELCKDIISQSDFSASSVPRNFEKFGLNQIDAEERFLLCKAIAGKGTSGAIAITQDFHNIGMNDFTPDQRLELCKIIVSQGRHATADLISNIQSFDLKDADPRGLFHLCENIALQGPESSHDILKDEFFIDLISGFKLLERLSLAKIIFSNFPSQALEKLDVLCLNINDIEEWLFTSQSLAWQLSFISNFPNKNMIGTQAVLELFATSQVIPPHLVSAYEMRYQPVIGIMSEVLDQKGEISDLQARRVQEALLSIKLNSLSDLCSKALKLTNERSKSNLIAWVAYTASVLSNLKEEQVKAINDSGLLELIFAHQSPAGRYPLLRNLSLMASRQPGELQALDKKQKGWTQLSSILLSRLTRWGLGNDQRKMLLNEINLQTGFKDTQKSTVLFQFLLTLIAHEPYTQEQIDTLCTLVGNALRKQKKKKDGNQISDIEIATKALRIFSNILHLFGKREFFESKLDPASFFLLKFQRLFPIEIDNIAESYEETFAKFRNPDALFTYLRRLHLLSNPESTEVTSALTKYVRSVMEGKFPEARYCSEESPHLQKVFQIDGLKEKWICGSAPKNVDRDKTETSDFDYRKFFYEKIIRDNHLNPKDYPMLESFLLGNNEVDATFTEDPKDQFQSLIIQLCQGTLEVHRFLKKVNKLKLDLGEHRNDLAALIPNQSQKEYRISETDDPCDLLLIGTEINGSCQRVDGDPSWNKCLVAYLINGEVRPIVIKDKDGKIVARSILRLMWDEESKTPVLLQERIYSNINDSYMNEMINNWAKERAMQLGIPLVSVEIGTGEPYKGSVEFLGGPAPYSYCDAVHGVRKGAFKVQNCHLLQP